MVVTVVVGAVGLTLTGEAFRKLEADIDIGGLIIVAAVDSSFSSSSDSCRIGCRILPDVNCRPPNDFDDSIGVCGCVCPPPFPIVVYPLLSHDKVRRRGALYSPPNSASVRDDKKE